MTTSPANQTRLKILTSILELERFTVAELCINAGLSRSQVYRELSVLDKSGALTSKPIRPEGKGPAFRPTKLYQLSSEPSVRQGFVREIGSFFPAFEDPNSNYHLSLAKKARDELESSLNSEAISQMTNAAFGAWEERCKEAIAEAEKSIQRANWESETDFSVGDHSQHPVIATARSIELLRSQFQQIYTRERSRRDKEAARPQWFEILIPVVRSLLPEVAALGLGPKHLRDIAGIFERLSEGLSSGVVKHYSKGSKNEALVQYLDALQLDLRTAQSKSDLLAVLAKHFISYGEHINETLGFAQRLAKESQNYRFVFNEANLAHLACKKDEAYKSWLNYISGRKSRAVLGERSLIARIGAKNWSLSAYEAAVKEITRDHIASLCAFAEVSFGSPHEHVIKPMLYNPILAEGEQDSAWIQLAEPLAPDTSLYALSTEAACPVMAGLPKIARANCFIEVLPEKDAWDLASKEDSEERVVKVDFFRAATPEARRYAAEVLTSNLSATMVG